MAELKHLPRQFLQPSAPDIRNIANSYAMQGEALQAPLTAIGAHFAEKRKDALNYDAKITAIGASESITKKSTELSTIESYNKYGNKTPEVFKQIATGILEGTISNVPEERQKDVSLYLQERISSHYAQLHEATLNHSNKAQQDNLKATLKAGQQDYINAVFDGRKDDAKAILETIRSTVDDYSSVMGMTPEEKTLAKRNLEKEVKLTAYEKDYIDSTAGDFNSKKGDDYLAKLAKSKPADLSWNEYGDLFPRLQAIKEQRTTALSGERALEFATAKGDIESGGLTSFEAIDNYKVSALQKEQLGNQLWTKLNKDMDGLQGLINSSQSIRMGLGRSLTSKNVDEWYNKVILPAEFERKQSQAAAKGEEFAGLTLKDKALAVRQSSEFGVGQPVPALNNEIYARLENGPSQAAVEAAEAYQLLAKDKNAFDKNDRARNLASKIYHNRFYSGSDTLKAVEDARAAINVAPEVNASRQERLKKEHKEDDYAKDYKRVFDKMPSSADTDLSYSLFKEFYDDSFSFQGDASVAFDVAADKIWPRFGKDNYGIPGKIYYLPISKTVPGYNAGQRLPNYIDMQIDGLIKRNAQQRAAGELPEDEKYEWGYRAKFPEEFSQNDFVNKRLVDRYNRPQGQEPGLDLLSQHVAGEHYIIYQNKRYDLYVDSDVDSGTRADGTPRYYGVILIDGQPKQLLDNSTQSGLFEIPIGNAYELTPELSEEMEGKEQDKTVEKYLEKRFDQQYPRSFLEKMGFTDTITSRINRRLKEKEFVEKRMAQTKDLLFGKKALIEEERAATGDTVSTGREIYQNKDGSVSTELSITVTDDRLNNGKPTNIPSLWDGKELSENESVIKALESGKKYESFNSIDEAVKSAISKSEKLGEEVKAKGYGNKEMSKEQVNALPKAEAGKNESVKQSISEAAKDVGVSDKLLIAVAKIESDLNPKAKAKTSTAAGLFQFTKATWKEVVQNNGKKYGVKIEDKLDAKANAIMGAVHLKYITKELKSYLKREPEDHEVYLAHFAGLGGAKKALNVYKRSPDAPVSEAFSSSAIKANKGLLKGTIKDVINRLKSKIEKAKANE